MSEEILNYHQRLLARTRKIGNSLCVGLDPVLKKLPPSDGNPADRIKRFYTDLLEAMARHRIYPAAVKPNIAYFEALGIKAMEVLHGVIAEYRSEGILVVLDAKRGDISTSSEAYAEAAFEGYGADAVTAAPYMGSDSIEPFQEKARVNARGIYVLVRTSNPGAKDFQDLVVDLGQGRRLPLYKVVAEKLVEWDRGDLGAVVGATAPGELEQLVTFWRSLGKEMPMLIPGISVGGIGQGGDVKEIIRAIRNGGGDPNLHLLNSSSGVNYAYVRFGRMSPAEASLKAMEELLEGMR